MNVVLVVLDALQVVAAIGVIVVSRTGWFIRRTTRANPGVKLWAFRLVFALMGVVGALNLAGQLLRR